MESLYIALIVLATFILVTAYVCIRVASNTVHRDIEIETAPVFQPNLLQEVSNKVENLEKEISGLKYHSKSDSSLCALRG